MTPEGRPNADEQQPSIVWPGIEKLAVISGGRTVDAGSELLGSPGMRNLAEDMKNRYPDRQVIFDVPSILTSADALSFAPLVDYIVVVVSAGHTSVRELQRALHMLPQEKTVGLVLNRGGGGGQLVFQQKSHPEVAF